MKRSPFGVALALTLAAQGAGCGDEVEEASNAIHAAKEVMAATREMQQAGEAADEAAKAAEEKARAEIPEGASKEEAEQFVEQAKAFAALEAMQKAGGQGPITNWRQLKPFLADNLGDYAAAGKLKGSTTKAGGFTVTHVERRYKAEKRRAQVKISDAFLAPMLKAPFQMAAMINEDSTEGYKKGTRIEGHTAIVQWREDSKRSQATILVAGRFMVEIKVNHAEADDEAVTLAKQLDLKKLATVVGKDDAN